MRRHRSSFIAAHTVQDRAPLVPEILLHLATEIAPIWQATETWLAEHNVAPPFWAFAWPGGQALARHVLDHPSCVAGRRVLDFAAGCGIAAIACAHAGAAIVEAAEIPSPGRQSRSTPPPTESRSSGRPPTSSGWTAAGT